MTNNGTLDVKATNVFDSPGRILAVGDVGKSSVAQILERHLHKVYRIERGAEVIACAEKNPIDLIICGLSLVDLDGFEICRRVKAHRELQFVPILLLGDAGNAHAQLRAFEAGANDFLTLPINETLLAARVRSVLKYRRAVSALRQAQSQLEKRVAERTADLIKLNEELKSQAIERSKVEQSLKTVLSGARCLLWRGKVTRANKKFTWKFDLFSFEALQRAFQIKFLPGHDDDDLWGSHLPREDCARMEKNALHAFESGQSSYSQDFRITAGDGKLRWLHEDVQITPIGSDAWDLVGVVVDITDRKHAEDALRDVLGSARCIVWYAHVAQLGQKDYSWDLHIVSSDAVRREFRVLPAAGETDSTMWGRLLREGDPDQLERMDRICHAALNEGRTSYQQEFALRGSDGSRRWLTESVVVSTVRPGEWHLVGVATDITDRKRAEEALKKVVSFARCVFWDARTQRRPDGNFSWKMRVFPSEFLTEELGFEMRPSETPEQMWTRMLDTVPQDVLQQMHARSTAAMNNGSRGYQNEYPVRAKDGTVRWLAEDVGIKPVNKDEFELIGVSTDISERKRTEEALRASEERYALAAEGANDGLFDWNLVSQEIYLSPRWKAMIGAKAEQIGTNPDEWFARVHPEDADGLRSELDAQFSGKIAQFQKEYRLLHKEGAYRWMLARGVVVRDEKGKPYRMVGSQTDITSRKTAELQVFHDAFHDILTGMPNRALFMDRLGQAMQHVLRTDQYRYAVLFLAIDRFDVVNDSLGHKSGDRLLMDISHRLLKAVRPGDTVARLGGAEFAILLDDTQSPTLAEEEAARIQQEFSRPFMVGEQEVFVSASIGIALSSPKYSHAEEVLRDADTAMRRAKEMGNRFLVFNSTMHSKVVSVLQLGTDLRWAVDRQEFVLFYQPIIALESGKLVGLEALIRWQKPNTGMVPPNDFIPLAEENGLIVPMTWWVLTEACRQMRTWRVSPHCNGLSFINVNLSSKMFLEPSLVARIKHTLEETGLEPNCLKFEITETALMEHTDAAASVLGKLRDLNIQIALDDFGTGYSSLSYLHRFPLDVLKIDRSFVSRMGSGGGNTEIVRTIVTLAQNLKLDAVAEGVETELQSERLRGLNCKYAQGYLYSKPVPAEKITELLASHKRW